MTLSGTLSAVGLIRPTKRGGFCPACRFFSSRSEASGVQVELAPPVLTLLAFLAVAAIAWALVLVQSRGGVTMGFGSVTSFSTSWVVMMAAMMLPTAMPLVFEFAREAEGRRQWQAAMGVLCLTYLSVWLAFGLICYVARSAFPAELPDQRLVGGVALVLSAVYGLTPFKRASEGRCRELCALHGPLPFNLMRSAVVVGAKYGLSCIGCSAALMVAMVLIGMSNLGWIVILSAVVLVYKLAPEPDSRRRLLLSAALVAFGVVYALTV